MHFSFIAYFFYNLTLWKGEGEQQVMSLGSTLRVSVAQLYLWGTPPTPGVMSKLLIAVTVEQRTKTEIATCALVFDMLFFFPLKNK